MKASILTGVVLVFAISSYGQDTLDARGPWSIGLSTSLDRAFRTIRSDDGSPITDYILAWREDRESPRTAFSLGIDVHFDLAPHWSLGSGLHFSDRGYASHHETTFIAIDPVDPVFGGFGAQIDERFHFQYLSLPLTVRFSPGKGRFRLSTAAGIQADLLAGNFYRIETSFSDGTRTRERESDQFTDFTGLGASAIFDIGCEMMVSSTWSVRLSSRARYQLTPVADAPIIGHLYEIGGAASVSYRL